jgi:tryptophan synthase alpha chain
MKTLNPTTPVVGGFGIDNPESARRIINCGADGVVVGTICIQTLASDGNEGLQDLLKSISTELALVSNQ